MKNIVLIASVFTLFACSKGDKVQKQNIKNEPVQHSEASSKSLAADSVEIKMETFGFPSEISGCSCYFAKDEKDFLQEKFLYIDDYGKNAFVKINNEAIKIPVKEHPLDAEGFNKDIENEQYKIHITGKKIKEMEEVMMFKGTMTVENKQTGAKGISPIYGECGC